MRTPSGTRALVYLTGISSEDGIDSSVINTLESNHLIREVSGARWHELTHDRLIGPIKDSNINPSTLMVLSENGQVMME